MIQWIITGIAVVAAVYFFIRSVKRPCDSCSLKDSCKRRKKF